jgi:hypothetical protein
MVILNVLWHPLLEGASVECPAFRVENFEDW